MKSIQTYKPLEEYVLRTHNLSSSKVSDLTVEKIKELCSSDLVSEAIFLASPELHQEMIKYLSGKKVRDEEKLIHSLLKYLLRMGHRCTPFGLFSGCSIGNIDQTTSIELEEPTKHQRFTRIDMSYLCSLVQKLEKAEEIRKELVYFPNNSLYPIGNKLRYIEYKYKNVERSHYTVSIDNSIYVERILKKAKKGATIDSLAQLLVEPEISLQDAKTFVNQLIDNQILISSISPSITGKNYLSELITKIPSKDIKSRLLAIEQLLTKLDKSCKGSNLKYYDELSKLLDSFEINHNKKFIFQTDLTITTKRNTISKETVKDIETAIGLLNKLSPIREDEKLTNFKRQFYKKFEDERVPLTLALDVETGVGYGFLSKDDYDISPLINGLDLSSSNHIQKQKNIKWTYIDEYLNKKLIESDIKGASEICIDEADLELFDEDWDNLPLSFSVIAHLLNNNPKNPLLSVSFAGGPSASYILGRYTQSNSKICEHVRAITRSEEEHADAIFAEIAHLPENRTGNILNRSHLRPYEIPYLTKSSLPDEQQITVDDILISIENDKIILFSKKHQKEVKPRMATAHNYANNPLPIYQFLCDLQTENLRFSLSFNWRNARQGRSFLPRLRFKNIILSPAEWVIDREEIKKISKLDNLSEWRKEKKLPQKILLVESDNELLIDLEHHLSVSMFLSTIKNRFQIKLKEHLFDEQHATVVKNEETFTNEVIFSFIKNHKKGGSHE